jgi:hypothetical protein
VKDNAKPYNKYLEERKWLDNQYLGLEKSPTSPYGSSRLLLKRRIFAVKDIMKLHNKHWKKGGSWTTKSLAWRKVLPPFMVPAALLGPSTQIRMCASALRPSGTAQGILPSGNIKGIAKI